MEPTGHLRGDQYLQLPIRDRAIYLRRLWQEIFGFDNPFVYGVRVGRYTEPRRDPKWSPMLSEFLRVEDNLREENNFRLARDIARSFARIQDPGGLPTLMFAMDSRHHKVRWWGAWGAGAIASPSALPRLIELLNDPNVQDAAAAALWQIGDPRGLGPLKEAATQASGDKASVLNMRAGQLERKLRRSGVDAS